MLGSGHGAGHGQGQWIYWKRTSAMSRILFSPPTMNIYLFPSETFPLSPSLSLSCSLCLSFARLLALSLSFARLFVLSFSFTRLVALSFSFVRLLALSLSFARLLALSLSQRCSCCFFRYFFLFCFTKLAKVIKTR